MSLAKSPDATGSFEDRRLVPIGVLEAVAAKDLIAAGAQRVIEPDVELIDVVVENAVRDEVVVEEACAGHVGQRIQLDAAARRPDRCTTD